MSDKNVDHSDSNGKISQGPERPPPPIVGKVTHHSVELYWEEALAKAQKNSKSRIKISVQEADRIGAWGNIFIGYAKRYIVVNLEKRTTYTYRLRFMNADGNSEWSPSVSVTTTDEPITGEHIHRAVNQSNTKLLEEVLSRIMEILLDHGADVNFQNEAGKTPLMLAAYEGQRDAVKELLARGAKLEMRDRGGSTSLHWGVLCPNLNMIDDLLDSGADTLAVDYNGWSALMRIAAVGGNRHAAEKLLRHTQQLIDVRDKDGKTALMTSVVNGHMELVHLLLEKGADISIKNEYGKTAYDMAISMEKRRVVKVLEEYMDAKGIKRYT
ncbi:hypothetical protein LSH36_947g01017 [Paralvinella palmiformis]|uniref:Fibronectin type-III domain-containing protein n=1 Tax=Paralvinella palmiformis TaxID=53620 RepID=A0AAD9IWY8_9ANNE|nr:hypothetical protein LSH36_947g01017 [Paralvinella palmiformis]